MQAKAFLAWKIGTHIFSIAELKPRVVNILYTFEDCVTPEKKEGDWEGRRKKNRLVKHHASCAICVAVWVGQDRIPPVDIGRGKWNSKVVFVFKKISEIVMLVFQLMSMIIVIVTSVDPIYIYIYI